MKWPISRRGSSTSIVEQLAAKARLKQARGEKVIYMQVGQPSTGAPAEAIAKATQAIQTWPLGYTPAAGIPELRQRIARHYQENYNTIVDANRIIITLGSSNALILTMLGCFDANARIGLPLPFYSGYRHALKALNINCVTFNPLDNHPLQPMPTVDDLEAIPGGLDGLIVASPANPTGAILKPQELKILVDYCHRKNILFISDEIYHGIVYQQDFPLASALQFSDEMIVLNGFSKYYSMSGWRIGWMVVPKHLAEPLTDLAHNLFLSPSAPAQQVALAAMDCEAELTQHVQRYARNREILLNELPQAGFDHFMPPDGAFYIYCRVKNLRHDSMQFCSEMLENCGVLASPGSDYDPHHGHHYVRFSYAGATDQIEEAVHRIKAWRYVSH